ncbi:hypothetical protein NDS46_30230 (plasmid) [Paenibacillus thiaminolyticus]|uniref:hypothetical protein n=1 Tax=Paenibacillus thiaminolyticus TaxID=49283 RepID=UPI00232A9FC9|nr:hypothetical protein [Paenibacillus thiaminolyticus]WCF11626.1 hypothetical protein NDS46_30230 [Paenibacillus thiaminolyticus]
METNSLRDATKGNEHGGIKKTILWSLVIIVSAILIFSTFINPRPVMTDITPPSFYETSIYLV